MNKPLMGALILLSGCSSLQIPETIKTSEKLMMIVPAKGDQIYECRTQKDGSIGWAFVAPDAELFDGTRKKIGTHYAGPHWEAADGSKVIATVKQRADAPAAGNIPWLLLEAKSVGKDGAFSKVTSIQRLATVGGVAPAGACTLAGTRARVPYTADYYFFTAK